MPRQSVRKNSRKYKQKGGGANTLVPVYFAADTNLIGGTYVWFPVGFPSISIPDFTNPARSTRQLGAPYSVYIMNDETYKQALESITNAEQALPKLIDEVGFKTAFDNWQRYYAGEKARLEAEFKPIQQGKERVDAKLAELEATPVKMPNTREAGQAQLDSILGPGFNIWGQFYKYVGAFSMGDQATIDSLDVGYNNWLRMQLGFQKNDFDSQYAYKKEEYDRTMNQYTMEYNKHWSGWQRYAIELKKTIKNWQRDIKHYLLRQIVNNLERATLDLYNQYLTKLPELEKQVQDDINPLIVQGQTAAEEYVREQAILKIPQAFANAIEKKNLFIKGLAEKESSLYVTAEMQWNTINDSFSGVSPKLDWSYFKPKPYLDVVAPLHQQESDIGQALAELMEKVPSQAYINFLRAKLETLTLNKKAALDIQDETSAEKYQLQMDETSKKMEDSIAASQAAEQQKVMLESQQQSIKKQIEDAKVAGGQETRQLEYQNRKMTQIEYFENQYAAWTDTDIDLLQKTATQTLEDMKKKTEEAFQKSQAELQLKLKNVDAKTQALLQKQKEEAAAAAATEQAKEDARLEQLKKEQAEWEAAKAEGDKLRAQQEAAYQAALEQAKKDAYYASPEYQAILTKQKQDAALLQFAQVQQQAAAQSAQLQSQSRRDVTQQFVDQLKGEVNMYTDISKKLKDLQTTIQQNAANGQIYLDAYAKVLENIKEVVQLIDKDAETLPPAQDANVRVKPLFVSLQALGGSIQSFKNGASELLSAYTSELEKYSGMDQIMKNYLEGLDGMIEASADEKLYVQNLEQIKQRIGSAEFNRVNISQSYDSYAQKTGNVAQQKSVVESASSQINEYATQIRALGESYEGNKSAFVNANITSKKVNLNSAVSAEESQIKKLRDIVSEANAKRAGASALITSIFSYSIPLSTIESEDGKRLYPELESILSNVRIKEGGIETKGQELDTQFQKATEAANQIQAISSALKGISTIDKVAFRQTLIENLNKIPPYTNIINTASEIIQKNKQDILSIADELSEQAEKAKQFRDLIQKADSDFAKQQAEAEKQVAAPTAVTTPTTTPTTTSTTTTTPKTLSNTTAVTPPPATTTPPKTLSNTTAVTPPPATTTPPKTLSNTTAVTPPPATTTPPKTLSNTTAVTPPPATMAVSQQVQTAVTNAKNATTTLQKANAKAEIQTAKQNVQQAIQTNQKLADQAEEVFQKTKTLPATLQAVPAIQQAQQTSQQVATNAKENVATLQKQNAELEEQEANLNTEEEEEEPAAEEEEEEPAAEEEENAAANENENENNQEGGRRKQTRRKKRHSKSQTKKRKGHKK